MPHQSTGTIAAYQRHFLSARAGSAALGSQCPIRYDSIAAGELSMTTQGQLPVWSICDGDGGRRRRRYCWRRQTVRIDRQARCLPLVTRRRRAELCSVYSSPLTNWKNDIDQAHSSRSSHHSVRRQKFGDLWPRRGRQHDWVYLRKVYSGDLCAWVRETTGNLKRRITGKQTPF